MWDDPERFRALAERAEPWPLRDHLPPPWISPPFLCAPGEGLPVLIGNARIRLPFFEYVDDRNYRVRRWYERVNDRLQTNWNRAKLSHAERCRARADWAAAPRITDTHLRFMNLVLGALDPRCYRRGLPGDPREECDRPRNYNWWLAFARGLPLDISLEASNLPRNSQTAEKRLDLDSYSPGHRLEPRPRGGWTVLAANGRPEGVLLERESGALADTADPLLVRFCHLEDDWQPPGAKTDLQRSWSMCWVSFRFRSTVDVSYRFYREVFDAPDIPALDKRVRDLVRRMLDGAETLPEAPEW